MIKHLATPIQNPNSELWRSVIEGSGDCILALDKEFKFIFFNQCNKQACKKLFGKTPAIGLSFIDDILADFPKEREEMRKILQRALEGETFTVLEEFSTIDSKHVLYETKYHPLRNEKNEIFGTASIARNITWRKEREQKQNRSPEDTCFTEATAINALHYQMQLTKTITDNTTSAFFIMDAQGYPTFMNPAAERITGYNFDEIRQQPLHYTIHYKYPDSRPYPMEECPIENSSATLVAMQNQEEVFVDKHARLFPVVWSIAPLERNGQRVGAVIEFRDVTLEKKAEQERLQAIKHAEEQERQRAEEAENYRKKQEEFIDTVCHEIRNPLNGIYGSIAMLKDRFRQLDQMLKDKVVHLEPMNAKKLTMNFTKMQQDLDSLEKCAQQQKSIVDDVLDLSKLDKYEIELNIVPFNLKNMLKAIIQMYLPQVEQKRLKLNLDMPAEEVYLKTDVHRLTQIISNLVSNAVKFTLEGRISITVELVPLSNEQAQLHVNIADTGIGMSPEEVSRLFDRFAQANRRTTVEFGGSGLGLAISKKLIEILGGTIEVQSQKWKGSQFEFYIVCNRLTAQEAVDIEAENKKRVLEESQSSSPKLAHKVILIVEDNKMNQKILTNYLEQKGHFCQVADNGLEAFDKIQKFQFDLVFMDIEMPIMNGLEATQKIREYEQAHNFKIPIIGLSGNARKELIEKGLKSGMDAYLTKPYHKEDIYRMLDEQFCKRNPTSEAVYNEVKLESTAVATTSALVL